jgi:chromosome segregation ATPase
MSQPEDAFSKIARRYNAAAQLLTAAQNSLQDLGEAIGQMKAENDQLKGSLAKATGENDKSKPEKDDAARVPSVVSETVVGLAAASVDS